jgi:hypothetical protein
MSKRIEIIMRNPGFEGTADALGAYYLDFEDENVFQRERASLNSELRRSANTKFPVISIANEKGEERGFNPAYYVSHRISEVEAWENPPWLHRSGDEAAPNAED